MIVLTIIWLLLLGVVLVLGSVMVRLMNVTAVTRTGDRFFLSVWTGILTLALLLLYGALWIPIGPWVFPGLVVVSGLIGIFNRSIRSDLLSYIRLMTPGRCAVGCLLVFLISYAEVQPICDRDVIIYHLDNIHALSRTGIVPGLGLIYHRYGFMSSWFTIPALFNHGPLTMHIAPAANGLVFLLLLGQLHMVAARILSRRGEATDWFILAAFLIPVVVPVFLNYAVSTTPDFFLIIGNLVIAWAAMMIYGSRIGAADADGKGLARQQLLPVWMAAVMFTIKMPALPMIAAIGLVYLLHQRFVWKAWIASGAVVAVAVAPFMAALAVLTGYPLYPNPWGLDLPWTMSPDSYHLSHNLWGKPGDTHAAYLTWAWLVEWLQLSHDCVIGFVLFIASWVVLAWIILARRNRIIEVLPGLLIGVVGMLFLVAKAPSVRFGWSYLAIVPCVVFYLQSDRLNRLVDLLPPGLNRAWVRHSVLVALWCLFVLVFSVAGKTDSEKRVAAADREGRIKLDRPNLLVWPPIPARLVFDDAKRIAEPYRDFEDHPEAYLDSPRPMFHPLIPRPGVRYLNPEKGIYGGFAHDLQDAP